MDAAVRLHASLKGRYEIEREIGAGGMATVYLARDLKHDRRVALKVLRPDLGAVLGVDRFLSEIRVTANLQHPNLLPLFDSGEADGLLFYVMPYVQGESLRARLDREKQLPVDEAVRIATAVASALGYAHRHGVIHRDLKPENILLHEGQPVVADFGIALAVSNAGAGRITQTGLSLGTPQYMSPEQATGDRTIDARTDIYSLGAMTYEMLVGDPPHFASTSQAIIAKVLTEKPAGVRVARPSVPENVEAAVAHALEKLPADRFASAQEFADALAGKVVVTRAATASSVATTSTRTTRERVLAGLVVVLSVSWAATNYIMRHKAVPPPARVQFDVATPPYAAAIQVSVAPDGRTLTFQTVVDGKRTIWSHQLGTSRQAAIPGTEEGGNPFWSPDSKYLGFTADRKLKRVALAGGLVEPIGPAGPTTSGVTWGSRGVIVFASGGRLFRIPASGGDTTAIATGGEAEYWVSPSFLPDGEHFIVVSRSSQTAFVASIEGGTPVRIAGATGRAAFAAPDRLVYARDGTLYAQRFDLRALRVTGDPVVIAEDVLENTSNGSASFAVSGSNVLVYRAGAQGPQDRRLRWYSREGVALEFVGEVSRTHQMNLSPDDRRVVMSIMSPGEATRHAWVLELATNIMSPLAAITAARGGGGIGDPIWNPSADAVSYVTASTADTATALSRRVGGTVDSLLYRSRVTRSQLHLADYTPDGRTLLAHHADSLLAIHLDGGATQFLAYIRSIDGVRVSPDGKHISYGVGAQGPWQVYVADYPSIEHRQQVSANGGVQARWGADGKSLYFISRDGQVMVASARPGPTLAFDTPRVLFPSPMRDANAVLDQWAVSRDGKRFLFLVSDSPTEAPPPTATVVLNWINAEK